MRPTRLGPGTGPGSMILVGLTGGIGSGKSTVSALLALKGAVIVDADAIIRELQQPGQPVLAAIADRFGPACSPPTAPSTGPAWRARVHRHRTPCRTSTASSTPPSGRDAPPGEASSGTPTRSSCSTCPCWSRAAAPVQHGRLVVVDIPVDVAVDRLVQYRAMDEADARARIGRQATREQRLAAADRVIDNSGDRESLAAQVDELWEWIVTLPPAPDEDPAPEPEASSNSNA